MNNGFKQKLMIRLEQSFECLNDVNMKTSFFILVAKKLLVDYIFVFLKSFLTSLDLSTTNFLFHGRLLIVFIFLNKLIFKIILYECSNRSTY